MAFNKKAVFVGFTLALLLVTYCAEAVKICTFNSKTFHGPCKSNKNCASACIHEGEENGTGYTGGHCSRKKWSLGPDGDDGFDLNWKKGPKCKCVKPCNGPSPPPGDEPPPGMKVSDWPVV
ncbi:uncharacterized protein LOC133886288 [Phragmites australis]|uniref:uncharacterized protein LOC133886288 n=1 Tax=Phragmites australis TaxID=29695 RepID=UPI002D76FC5B|nr:uncharacterized protein LOC133886288 [Phragmites australis]